MRSRIDLIKYWFSVNDEEGQERRFQESIEDPIKRWKLEPDGRGIAQALGGLFHSCGRDGTAIPTARKPRGTSSTRMIKKQARLNCIRHLLDQISYQEVGGRSRLSFLLANQIPTISDPRSRPSVSSRGSIEPPFSGANLKVTILRAPTDG